ncbi:hypothetical protein [Natronobiforma cellulositropha]|nr:hypothetical protein [Natronobiforma cellulositropha]
MSQRVEDETEFCAQCETVQPVKRTVPWQPDLCMVCGADIDEAADRDR